MRIVFLSNHWYPSPRRAGFHHLADACHTLGHDVTFATVGFSWLSYARRDFRTRYNGIWQARNRMQAIKPGLQSYVHFTPWHPHTLLLPALNRLTRGVMQKYDKFSLGPLQEAITTAQCIIYESSAALHLFDLCKRLAPKATHVYRVSDDIRILRSTHPAMLTTEQRIAPFFDSISVPCAFLQEKFQHCPNTRLHFHGIGKQAFDAASATPYTTTNNCIFVGNSHLDNQFLTNAASALPHVYFHIIGPMTKSVTLPNVHYYGEMPFASTVPYVKFADVGLQNRVHDTAAASLTDSLKVMQYRYCGLPIVAPTFLNLRREGVFYYQPENAQSCAAAVQQALAHGKHPDYAQEVNSWQDVAEAILHEAAATSS